MLALLDAGVAMCVRAAGSRSSPRYSQAHPIVLPRHDLLCACACAVLDDGLVLVDPNRSELSMGGGTAVAHMPVALLPRSGRISLVTTDRTMPIEHFERALASATAGAKALDAALREQLSSFGLVALWRSPAFTRASRTGAPFLNAGERQRRAQRERSLLLCTV